MDKLLTCIRMLVSAVFLSQPKKILFFIYCAIQRQWYQKTWFAKLLKPIAEVNSWFVTCRYSAYKAGRFCSYRAAVPTVVVGNLYIGGTGKTPVVMAIVKALKSRGFFPGVVSRGYGTRPGVMPKVGRRNLSTDQYGDEPVDISQSCQVPISVHPDRAKAIKALLQQYPSTDVVVSDDGLQHLPVVWDIKIVVQDDRGLGNGLLLPAGPLREPVSRLREVDAVINNLGYCSSSMLSDINKSSKSRPRETDMYLEVKFARNLYTGEQRALGSFLHGSNFSLGLVAVAGIGRPERFFFTLREIGITLNKTISLHDHFSYKCSPFTNLVADVIFVTSKDAVKCATLNDPRIWVVPITARFSDKSFVDWLVKQLRCVNF